MYIYRCNAQCATVNKEGYDSQDYNVQSMYTLLRTTMYRYMVIIYITYVICLQFEAVNK